MAGYKDPDRGIPGASLAKKGTLTKLFQDLQTPNGGGMTPAELESYKKRKKLEDEAQAKRDAAASQNPANRQTLPKLSDLFK